MHRPNLDGRVTLAAEIAATLVSTVIGLANRTPHRAHRRRGSVRLLSMRGI